MIKKYSSWLSPLARGVVAVVALGTASSATATPKKALPLYDPSPLEKAVCDRLNVERAANQQEGIFCNNKILVSLARVYSDAESEGLSNPKLKDFYKINNLGGNAQLGLSISGGKSDEVPGDVVSTIIDGGIRDFIVNPKDRSAGVGIVEKDGNYYITIITATAEPTTPQLEINEYVASPLEEAICQGINGLRAERGEQLATCNGKPLGPYARAESSLSTFFNQSTAKDYGIDCEDCLFTRNYGNLDGIPGPKSIVNRVREVDELYNRIIDPETRQIAVGIYGDPQKASSMVIMVSTEEVK